MSEIQCIKCLLFKPVNNFYISRIYKDCITYRKVCKNCRAKQKKVYWDINKDRFNHKNKPINRLLYYEAKRRATNKNLEFSIILEDIVIPEYCPVFGFKLNTNLERNHSTKDFSPSLDRIDNNKGYIKGNIVVVSYKANKAKNNLSIEELNQLYKFYNNLNKTKL